MDEALKRRLIGAGLLLIAAFALVSMLPEPRLRTAPEADLRVVTIDLNAPEVPAGEPVELSSPDAAAPSTPPASSAPVGEAPTESAARASEEGAPPEIEQEAPETVSAPAPVKAPPAEPSRPAPPPAVATKPAAPAQTTPAQVAAAKPPTAKGGPSWWVQIGSYSDIDNARQVEVRLRELQQPAVVAPIDTAKGTLYRVRGGPYASEAQAKSAHEAIMRSGYADARMVNP